MFRFIELLALVILLWFIANFLHYIIYCTGAIDQESGNWLFGMSDSWIRASQRQKHEGSSRKKSK